MTMKGLNSLFKNSIGLLVTELISSNLNKSISNSEILSTPCKYLPIETYDKTG